MRLEELKSSFSDIGQEKRVQVVRDMRLRSRTDTSSPKAPTHTKGKTKARKPTSAADRMRNRLRALGLTEEQIRIYMFHGKQNKGGSDG